MTAADTIRAALNANVLTVREDGSRTPEHEAALAALARLVARAERADTLEAALQLNQAVAEAADRYTDVVAQSADVSFEDDAWMELCSALRDWSSARAAGGVAVEEPQP